MKRSTTAYAVRLVFVLAIAISLTACGNIRNRANEGRTDAGSATQMQQMVENDGWTNYDRIVDRELGTSNNMHNNTNVEMSQDIADRITNMPEVTAASVLLTNQNAYIAVMLSDEADEGLINSPDRRKLSQNRQDNREDERLDQTRMKRYYNEAADVTTMLKDRITKEVKNEAPHILNVYISANPDFIDRMNGFIDQIQAGNPVRGFINEVNTTMERMFPTNNGPNITPNETPGSTQDVTRDARQSSQRRSQSSGTR